MDRVCVFIDGSGFYFGLKSHGYPTRVDYYELSKALVGPDRELVRSFYYNSAYDPVLSHEQWKIQQPFFDSLDRTPYLELRLGKLFPQKEGGFKEKGADVLVAGDLLYYAARNLFDTALVITDNPDFVSILSNVMEFGKHVELALFPWSQPKELVHSADLVVPLVEVLEKLKLKVFPSHPKGEELDFEDSQLGNRVQDSAPKVTMKPKNANRFITS